MRKLPSLGLSRRSRLSQIERPEVAVDLIELRANSEIFFAFDFEPCRKEMKMNYFCLDSFRQHLLIKCRGMWSAGSNVSSSGPYP